MKLPRQKRKRITEMIKAFAIYILLVGLTASLTLNYMLYKEPLSSVSTNTNTVKESLKDVEIKYIEVEKPYYFDNDNNEWQEFTITGYSANDPSWPQGTNNIVATGFDVDKPYMARLPIAASNCIPVYSIVEIEGVERCIPMRMAAPREARRWSWRNTCHAERSEASGLRIRDYLKNNVDMSLRAHSTSLRAGSER